MTRRKTLRLNFPQWQGGNIGAYHFGSQLLSLLAPAPKGAVETVEVPEPDGVDLSKENGIVARRALLRQTDLATEILNLHQPDCIVVLGGDCLVDLAPFAYLNQRYGDELAVLWIDAHADVATTEHTAHAHAMVLGNLLGKGDAEFAKRVESPIKATHVMYAGLYDMSPAEWRIIQDLGMGMATPSQLADSSGPVINWLTSIKAKHVAIHFDLDVIDPTQFRSLNFTMPNIEPHAFEGVPRGRMTMAQVVRLINDVAKACDVVGLGITEHLPWDALAIRDMLRKLPLLRD